MAVKLNFLGSDCYANAALQCILGTPIFFEHFIEFGNSVFVLDNSDCHAEQTEALYDVAKALENGKNMREVNAAIRIFRKLFADVRYDIVI